MLHPQYCKRCRLTLVPLLPLVIRVYAQDPETERLQTATQNPVASLISVPIQNNSNFNIGPANRTQDVLNIQPVIPIGLGEDWNLIIRWITPVISQPVPTQKGGRLLWLRRHGALIFPVTLQTRRIDLGFRACSPAPIATGYYTGQGKFGMGPSLVLLTQPGRMDHRHTG